MLKGSQSTATLCQTWGKHGVHPHSLAESREDLLLNLGLLLLQCSLALFQFLNLSLGTLLLWHALGQLGLHRSNWPEKETNEGTARNVSNWHLL